MTKTDELRELFARLSPVTTFTDRQSTDRGRGLVPSDDEVDAALRELVGERRRRDRFRTSLDDDDLVAVVRGFYAGRSDAEIARLLDGGADRTDVVTRARLHLHLFRETDRDPSIPAEELRTLLAEGRTIADCAADLGVSERAVRRTKAVLEARRAARESGYATPLEFEALLGDEIDEEMTAASQADRAVFDGVRD
jgi:hypothetical protein